MNVFYALMNHSGVHKNIAASLRFFFLLLLITTRNFVDKKSVILIKIKFQPDENKKNFLSFSKFSRGNRLKNQYE